MENRKIKINTARHATTDQASLNFLDELLAASLKKESHKESSEKIIGCLLKERKNKTSLTLQAFVSQRQILRFIGVDALGADERPHRLAVHLPPRQPSVVHNRPPDVSIDGGVHKRGVKTGSEATLLDGGDGAGAAAERACRGAVRAALMPQFTEV